MSADWYAKKLAAKQPAPLVPDSQPAPQYFRFDSNTPVPPVQQTPQPTEESVYAPRGAAHIRAQGSSGGRCPDCNSQNYFAVHGTKPRCIDCGYPLVQAGSGVSSTGSSGIPTAQARQVSGAGGGGAGTWGGGDFSSGKGVIGKDPTVRSG